MALENYDCLLGKQGRRLTEEETEHFIRIFGGTEDQCKRACEGIIRDGHRILGIMLQRLEMIGKLNGLEWDQIIEPKLALLLAIFLGRPGDAVMWAYTLWKRYTQIEDRVDVDDWSNVWAMGVPSDEELKEAWYAQKDPNPKPFDDNFIDHFENWSKLEPGIDPVMVAPSS